jgi:hypothetical protein
MKTVCTHCGRTADEHQTAGSRNVCPKGFSLKPGQLRVVQNRVLARLKSHTPSRAHGPRVVH